MNEISSANQSLMQVNPEINFFGLTNYRNQNRKFGIKIDDRRRHMYLVGKTGMGKTTILENMVLNDIYAGHGVGLVDPHGDFAEKVIDFIPPHRVNDIVYFNPADIDFPIGFNILESVNPEYRHLVASGLMGVFKKIWPDVWSARMEYILNNTILALLDFPGTTLLGINRLLADDDYRKKVIGTLKDPVVKAFWENEFEKYDERFRREAIAPIQNKIGQFLSASVIRNIVAQVKSRINIREIMDTQKIFIMNLSKGRIGEDNSRLLGGMLITKIQLSAMERVDIPEPQRKDFFLYVDEFQNFATESFANILSEARKYRLDLIMAHQYMEQLDEKVLAAVIGNVGTMVTFRVGSSDAEILAKEFIPTFVEEDLVNLPKYHVYLKLMIDGVASRPFSALTLPPIGSATGSREKVVRVSRERYAVSRDKIETKIARWSGMVIEGVTDDFDDDDELESIKTREDNPITTLPAVSPPLQKNEPTMIKSAKETSSARVSLQRIGWAGGKKNSDNNNNSSANRQAKPSGVTSARTSFSGAPSQTASFDNKKQNNRKKRKSNSFNSVNSEKVFLVDPAQKGISLSQVLKTAPPPRQNQSGIGRTQSSSFSVDSRGANNTTLKNDVKKPEQRLNESPKRVEQNSNSASVTIPTQHGKPAISLTQLKTPPTPPVVTFKHPPSLKPAVSSQISKKLPESTSLSSPKPLKPGEITKLN